MNPTHDPAPRNELPRRRLLRNAMASVPLGAGVATHASTSENQSNSPVRNNALQIIDVHCHPRWIGHNGAKTVQNMDKAGIDSAWLISWELPQREMSPHYFSTLNPTGIGIQFRDVIEMTETYPDRFVPGTTTDPRDPHAHQKLKAAVDIHGVRVFGEFKLRLRYDDPDALRLFHYAGELGLPVIFHLDVTFPRHGVPHSRQWWYGGGLENMESALKLCPNTQFLGHAPGFWREISEDADNEPSAYPRDKPIVGKGRLLQYLDKYPNLNCDLSAGSGLTALSRDLAFTRKFMIDYQDRLFFGRDDFNNDLFNLLIQLQLPCPVLEKILSGNALKLVPRT